MFTIGCAVVCPAVNYWNRGTQSWVHNPYCLCVRVFNVYTMFAVISETSINLTVRTANSRRLNLFFKSNNVRSLGRIRWILNRSELILLISYASSFLNNFGLPFCSGSAECKSLTWIACLPTNALVASSVRLLTILNYLYLIPLWWSNQYSMLHFHLLAQKKRTFFSSHVFARFGQ